MRPARTRTLADLVTDVLADGPRTGFEIARALAVRHGLELPGHEGSLYAALLQMERAGWVESAWTDAPEGARRRVYRLPVLVPFDAGEAVP